MHIIEQQQLWFDNILSYRTRVEEASLISLIRHIENNIDALDLRKSGDILFSITERIEEPNKTILGVELLVPVDKQFESSCRYVFKSRFRLENALISKFSGKISELREAQRSLVAYASDNDIKAITDVYYLVRSIYDESCVIDMYIGTSGNSL